MRRRVALTFAFTAVLGAAVAGPHAARADSEPSPTPVVASSAVVGALRQNADVQARDNGTSVKYDNRSVWFFDDTMKRSSSSGFVSNSAATTSDLDASDGIDLTSSTPFEESATASPEELITRLPAEERFESENAAAGCTPALCGSSYAFWPGGAVADPQRHRILVQYGKLCRGGSTDGPCASGLVGQNLGTGIAAVDMKSHRVTRLTATGRPPIHSVEGDDPTMFFTPGQEWGGQGMFVEGDTLYAYGRCRADGCAVAEAPLASVQDVSTWRYYTGDQGGTPKWSASPADAVTVIGTGAGGGSVNRDTAMGGYLHTYMPFGSGKGMYQTAAHPWGPFTAPKELFTATPSEGALYASFAHPEYDENDGLRKFFTYYDAHTGEQKLVKVDFRRP